LSTYCRVKMAVDFESVRQDFANWKANYMRKSPGNKSRLEKMTIIPHYDLENALQNDVHSLNADGNVQRYVYVGKCSAAGGFNAILADSVPKTSQYQQVKARTDLTQIYIVDLDTVPDAELGFTEDAVLTRCGTGEWSLNSAPQRNRYVYVVIFGTADAADVN